MRLCPPKPDEANDLEDYFGADCPVTRRVRRATLPTVGDPRSVRFEYRKQLSGSWFDPECSRSCAHKLSTDLLVRTKVGHWQSVTLTYGHEFGDARGIFRAMRTGQHVNKFIKRLERLLGYSLKARWICKLEFQMKNGREAPHFHLLIQVNEEHRFDCISERVHRAWGHGFVKVKPVKSGAQVSYFAKYMAKGDSYPTWILVERARSVKVIRTSPGFWEGVRKTRPSSHDPFRYKKPEPSIYRCIGHTLGSKNTIVRTEGVYSRVPLPRHEVDLRVFHHSGRRLPSHRSSWRAVIVPSDLVDSFMVSLWSGSASGEAAADPARDLIEKRNLTPECSGDRPADHIPAWFLGYLEGLGRLESAC